MRKSLLLICLVTTLLSGCSRNTMDKIPKNEITELESRIVELETELSISKANVTYLENRLEQLNNQLEEFNLDMDSTMRYFPEVSSLALEFVRAHTKGDLGRIQELVNDSVKIISENKVIYGQYSIDNESVKVTVYDEARESRYKDMTIQGYLYNVQDDTCQISLVEFYDEGDTGIFLNLIYKRDINGWKISNIDFDI